MDIVDLTSDRIDEFYDLFTNILTKDFPEYKSEHIEYFLEKLYSKLQIRVSLESNYRKTLVSIEKTSITGFLMADQTFGGVGFISWLGVKNDFREYGVGSKLLSYYEKFCKSKNAHLVEVYTFPKSEKFYQKNGFKIIGAREKGYFGVKNIIMDKEI